MRRPLLVLALVAGVAPAAAQDAGEAVDGIAAGHIVPRYAAFAAATGDLAGALGTDCADGRLDGGAARPVFERAVLAWQGVQHIRFGPIMTEDRHYRIAYWPDKHGQGERQVRRLLAGPAEAVPDATRIGSASAAVQGLPVLERLLYGDDGGKANACRLAVAVAGNVAAIAADTAAEWAARREADPAAMLVALVRGLLDQLDLMRTVKLRAPLGTGAAEARPRQAELWRSGLSYRALAANFAGLAGLFDGEDGHPGLRAALPPDIAQGRGAAAVAEHLGYGARFIGWQTVVLTEAVADPELRRQPEFLASHIGYTIELVRGHVAGALGAPMGFNSQDGD